MRRDDKAPSLDPRIARTRAVVRDAVLAELAEVGVAGLTVESIAERSGVAKSTLYRHWTGRLDLVADALATRSEAAAPDPAWTSAREAVATLLRHLVAAMADPETSPGVAALVEAAERDEAVATAFHRENERRRGALVQVISDGVERGELPATVDPEVATSALAGAVFYQRFMVGAPLAIEDVDDLVTTVIGPAET